MISFGFHQVSVLVSLFEFFSIINDWSLYEKAFYYWLAYSLPAN